MGEPMPGRLLTPGPAAEIALKRRVEKFLPEAEPEWLIRASRHVEALLRAKAKAGELPKWVSRRYPNGQETIMYALTEKRPGEVGPLEEIQKLLRARLFEEAERLIDEPGLSPEHKQTLKEILRELRRAEQAGHED